jgi:hypothetical protein
MSSQNEMLKSDILDVLSKQISGGEMRTAYPNSNVPKTDFGLAGAVPKKKQNDTIKKDIEKALNNYYGELYKLQQRQSGSNAIIDEDEYNKLLEAEKDDLGVDMLRIKDKYKISDGNTAYFNPRKQKGPGPHHGGLSSLKLDKFDLNKLSNYKKLTTVPLLYIPIEYMLKKPDPKKNPDKQPKKNPDKQPKKQSQRIDPLHQVSKEDAKKSKSVIPKKIQDKLDKATTIEELEQIKKDYGTTPKDKPKKTTASKKPLTEYQEFVKEYSSKNKNLGKDLMKKASIAWKAFKKTPEFEKRRPNPSLLVQDAFKKQPKSKAKSLFPPSKKDNKKVNKLTDEKLKKYLSEEDAFLDMINKRDGKPAPKKKSGRTGIQRGVIRVKNQKEADDIKKKKKSGKLENRL